jgi:predicted N-acetyltransferase YhbS
MDLDNVEAEPPGVLLRALKAEDLDRLVRMDKAHIGRSRQVWLGGKLRTALESGIRVSLGAEVDGTLVGALLGSVQYGEFGQAEPVAILDTILVDPGFTGRHIGDAMLVQLMRNLGALRIERLRTEVGWNEQGLIGFLAKEGFAPAARFVLERAVG